MRARDADVWVGGLLLAVTLAFAGHALGEAAAETGSAPGWPSMARLADDPLGAFDAGARWFPMAGGVTAMPPDAPADASG